MKSIKQKILIRMILTVAISLITVGVVGIYLTYTSTSDTLEQTMKETAAISAERVSQELQAYKNIAIETGSTARLANSELSITEKKTLMNQKVSSYNLSVGGIIGPDGIGILDGANYKEYDYFNRAMKGEASITDPIISEDTGAIRVMVAAPLWQDGNPGTKVVGVVYIVPHENFLNDIVASIQVSDNGSAYMLNSAGYTIAHRNADNVKNKENTAEDAKSDPSLAELAGLEHRMTKLESDFGRYRYGGVTKFLAFAPIDGTDGWSIGINAPTRDFMSTAIMSIYITIGLLIAALLISGMLALSLANGIGKPIRLCADRLNLLAGGDLKAPVPQIHNRDETGTLAEATQTIVSTMSGIINDMDYGLGEMAKGNFSVDSQSKDLYVGDFQSLAQSMYTIINQLTGTLVSINQSADQVSSGSDQVSAGAQALSQGTTEQAASVEELAATINEISGQVKENAVNAQQASSIVDGLSGEMVESNQKMQRMIQAMQEISQSSGEIGKIIKTIEDIAFQTNILALNAAVEAARAGAAGKGFAVVADEVRNLASKSAEASKSTSALIENSINSVANGTKIADDTASALMSVVEGAHKVAQAMNRISQASGEQAMSIAQVTQGIDQISAVVQTNSATAEESAAASEELSGQAQILKAHVARFRLPGSSEAVQPLGNAGAEQSYNASMFEPSGSGKY